MTSACTARGRPAAESSYRESQAGRGVGGPEPGGVRARGGGGAVVERPLASRLSD